MIRYRLLICLAASLVASWTALAAFGLFMSGAALVVGYCIGMVFTRWTGSLAGAAR